MKNKRDSTLFIGATHGDEPLGVEVLREISKQEKGPSWIIGNPKALERGTREFEGDLNRSAPGDRGSKFFAKRRAAEIMELAQSYERVVDIHGTVSNTGIFIIMTRECPETWALAKEFDIARVVVWPSITPDLEGPLSESLPYAIEIECGPKDSSGIKTDLKEIIQSYLNGSKRTESQTIFEVYGALKCDDAPTSLKEFTLVEINGESFYPLLIGQYASKDIACYKLRKRSS